MRFTPYLLALTLLVTPCIAQNQAAGTGQITGRVVSAETGEPIASAEVDARMPLGEPGWFVPSITDKDGHYTLGWLPAATLTVTAGAPGYAFQTFQHPDDPNPATNTLIPLADAASIDSIDFRLQPAGKLHGTIADTTGKPVGAGIFISAYQQTSDAVFTLVSNTSTDKDGHFIVDRLPPGVYRLCAGGADNSTAKDKVTYRKTWLGDTATPDNSQTAEVRVGNDGADLRILLPPTTPYKLTIVPKWIPPPGTDPSIKPTYTADLSDDAGRYEIRPDGSIVFANLPAGKYHLTVTAFDAHTPIARGTADVDISTADVHTEVKVTPIPDTHP